MRIQREAGGGCYTVTDVETGELLIFSLWGELEHVRLFDLVRKFQPPAAGPRDYLPVPGAASERR